METKPSVNNKNDNCDCCGYHNNWIIPRWLVALLGIFLVIFLGILIVQKGNDLRNTIANRKPANTISVSGEGKVDASPDSATVSIGVLSEGTTATNVKDVNNKKVNNIISFIKQQGIDEKDITTSQFYFSPTQNYNNGQPIITGYQGNQTITVKVHGVDKSQSQLEKILDGAVNEGANQIQGINFSFQDPDGLKQQARKEAIAKAKVKAQELASESGLTLGKVVSVSESSGNNYPGPMPYALDSMGAGGGEAKSVAPTIQPGTQSITETMTVVFELK